MHAQFPLNNHIVTLNHTVENVKRQIPVTNSIAPRQSFPLRSAAKRMLVSRSFRGRRVDCLNFGAHVLKHFENQRVGPPENFRTYLAHVESWRTRTEHASKVSWAFSQSLSVALTISSAAPSM